MTRYILFDKIKSTFIRILFFMWFSIKTIELMAIQKVVHFPTFAFKILNFGHTAPCGTYCVSTSITRTIKNFAAVDALKQ